MFFNFVDFANGNLPWATIHHTTEFREHVDIRLKNVGYIKWDLFGTTCWSFLLRELQGPVYTMPMNFTDIIVKAKVEPTRRLLRPDWLRDCRPFNQSHLYSASCTVQNAFSLPNLHIQYL